jgi:hypothetical protein
MGRNPVGVAESSVESPGLKQPWELKPTVSTATRLRQRLFFDCGSCRVRIDATPLGLLNYLSSPQG